MRKLSQKMPIDSKQIAEYENENQKSRPASIYGMITADFNNFSHV